MRGRRSPAECRFVINRLWLLCSLAALGAAVACGPSAEVVAGGPSPAERPSISPEPSVSANDEPRLPPHAMSLDEFWELIGVLEGASDEAAMDRLASALRARGDNSAEAFAERLAERLYRLDTERHFRQQVRWSDAPGAAPIPLSEDTFLYLRAGVVARGKATYEAVLADPARLSSGLWDDGEFLLTAANDAAGEVIETAFSYETGSNEQRWS